MSQIVDLTGIELDDVDKILTDRCVNDTQELVFRGFHGFRGVYSKYWFEICKKILLLVPDLHCVWLCHYGEYAKNLFTNILAAPDNMAEFFNFMLESRANLYTICHKLPATILFSWLYRFMPILSHDVDWRFVTAFGFDGKSAQEILNSPQLLASKKTCDITRALHYAASINTFDIAADIREQTYILLERIYDDLVAFHHIKTKPEPPCAVQFVDIGELKTV